jgi:alpha-beta hydrolase superfamily lysophospholipase
MKGRAVRRLSAAALGVLLALLAVPVLLCENAIHILPRFRYTPNSELAASLARETGAAWQAAEIAAADGAVLRGWWFTPAQTGSTTAILLHGVADTRVGMLAHARFLLRNGFAVLAPDARGHGASGGDRISYGLMESADVHRWADWISGQQRFPELYGLGESMGAAILLQSLRVEPRFRRVVAECPFFNFEEIAYDRLSQFGGLNRIEAWPLVQPAFSMRGWRAVSICAGRIPRRRYAPRRFPSC